MVELLFLPSVYAPCPACHGARYNAKTLEIRYRGQYHRGRAGDDCRRRLRLFRRPEPVCARRSTVLRQVGLGYLRLGQPATELSGGEAQRIKLATELQRAQRGNALYVLDEPTTGLHPADVDRLMTQLDGSSTPATRSSWSSTTCASSPAATGSSTSAPAREKTAARSSRRGRPRSWPAPGAAAPRRSSRSSSRVTSMTWRGRRESAIANLHLALCGRLLRLYIGQFGGIPSGRILREKGLVVPPGLTLTCFVSAYAHAQNMVIFSGKISTFCPKLKVFSGQLRDN